MASHYPLKWQGSHGVTFVCVLLIATGVAIQRDLFSLSDWVPEHYLPWEPLHLSDPPGLVTRWKLSQLDDDPKACRRILEEEAGGRVTPLPDQPSDVGCELIDTWRMAANSGADADSDGVRFNNSFMASCPLAVSWLRFERFGLQPTAEAIFGQRVAQVNHVGSFACRNIYGRKIGRRSEHATADALDIVSFRLEDGQLISLPGDWPEQTLAQGEGGPETTPDISDEDAPGHFLQDIQRAACQSFGTVLGPEYNAAHRDHFHLGTRGFRICR